jgi:aldose 1-epimerase
VRLSISPPSLQSAPFALLPDGRRVDKVTLSNDAGVSVELLTYGATVTSVKVRRWSATSAKVCQCAEPSIVAHFCYHPPTPCRPASQVPSKATGPEEVTLCYADFESLRTKSPFYGSTVGRVANRIAKGVFEVDGATYRVAANNGANHLHGGLRGLDKAVWTPTLFAREGAVGVRFSYESHDGEEGYPGNLSVTAEYALSAGNELSMEFAASTDKATPINMCNHAYWNLSGGLRERIHDHVLTLHAPYYVVADGALVRPPPRRWLEHGWAGR